MKNRANVSQKIPSEITDNSKAFSVSATSTKQEATSLPSPVVAAFPSPAPAKPVTKPQNPSSNVGSRLAVVPVYAPEKCPFNLLVNDFLESCRLDGLSAKTISDYASKLPKFRWWWFEGSNNAEKLGSYPNQVTVKEARAFAAYLREPNSFRWGLVQHEHRVKFELSPFSVQSYGRAVKSFFNWLEREGYIEQTPFNKSVRFTNRHKQDRVVKRVENEDLARLFEYLTGSEVIATFAGARNLSMISFLLDTGIRRGELLSMKIGSLNLDQLRCHVNGKTGHRYVPFSPSCRDALRRYLQHPDYPGPVNPNNPKVAETALWLTYQGKELTYYGFSEVLRKIVRKSGVKFHAHRLAIPLPPLWRAGYQFSILKICWATLRSAQLRSMSSKIWNTWLKYIGETLRYQCLQLIRLSSGPGVDREEEIFNHQG